MAKVKALKWSIQIRKEACKNRSEKNRAYKMLKRTTKPLRRTRVLIEESLERSFKKQHSDESENTDKWHLCKAGSFSYGESPRTPPLEELHSTGETIVWRDPGGSWACLPPVYICVWNHPATGCVMWTTPKKHSKKRETLRNANQNKTTRRAGYKKVYAPHPPPSKKAFRIKVALWNAAQNKNTNNNS